MKKWRKYKKIKRYVHRKIGLSCIKRGIKYFFCIDNDTKEERKRILQRERVLLTLLLLSFNLIFGENPYDEKRDLARPEYNQWIKKYIDNIFLITEDDIDLIFYVIKQI